MGKFYTAAISTTDPTARATSISNWFDNLEGISSEVIDYSYSGSIYKSANITIDGTDIEILFGLMTTKVEASVLHVKNGENINLVSDTPMDGASGNVTDAKLYAYIDNNCIMLLVYQSNKYNPSDTGIEVIYLKTTDNKHLVGYFVLSSDTSGRLVDFADISLLTYENVDDTARVPYKYTNMFPYVATAGTIDFTNEAFFVNNDIRQFTSDLLKECSTVPLLSTQSLPTGNCIALGAHCLVPLDDE